MAVRRDRVEAAAVPAEALVGEFPEIDLPVRPPFPPPGGGGGGVFGEPPPPGGPPSPPREAGAASRLPGGEGWLYEPKWDGFRCLAFRKGKTIALQSKSGQPLDRYFPEMVEAFGALPLRTFVLDGEIVIETGGGLDFDALLQRIHPAASRIRKLARETPASFHAFDLLVDERGRSLIPKPLSERRERLEALLGKVPRGGRVLLSPATPDRKRGERWMKELGGAGLDGVVAKLLESPYL